MFFKARRKKNFLQHIFEFSILIFVVIILLSNWTYQIFKISSTSMKPTLEVDDFILASRFHYIFSEVKARDLVIFRFPKNSLKPKPKNQFLEIIHPIYFDKYEIFNLRTKTFFHLKYHERKKVIKRVVAVPGDSLKIDNGEIFVNGKFFEIERKIDMKKMKNSKPIFWKDKFMGNSKNFGPVVIPKGKYFVLGDNYTNSYDSRFWGFLDKKEIIGKARLLKRKK